MLKGLSHSSTVRSTSLTAVSHLKRRENCWLPFAFVSDLTHCTNLRSLPQTLTHRPHPLMRLSVVYAEDKLTTCMVKVVCCWITNWVKQQLSWRPRFTACQLILVIWTFLETLSIISINVAPVFVPNLVSLS